MTLRAAKKRLKKDVSVGIKDLRQINVLVLHPDDEDGRSLIAQLQRIGCQIRVHWPVPERLPAEGVEVIMLAVSPDSLASNSPWLFNASTPPIVPIITYENPIIVEALIQLNASAVIASPVRAFGVLAALAVTLNRSRQTRDREKHIKRLEGRMATMRTVQQAKLILIETRGMSEIDAYNALRDQAMAKREPVEKIAEALVKANELLHRND